MSVPGLDVLVRLIGAEIEWARSATGDGCDAEDRTVLDRLAVAFGGLAPKEGPVPVPHAAVDRWVDAAVVLTPERQRPLAEAFRLVAAYLVWKTAYAGAPSSTMMRNFWANYAYALLASPGIDDGGDSPLLSPEMSLYLVVHGAGVEYGRHHHPAVEVYGIISGSALWFMGDRGFRRRRPGDVFVHQADIVHATTTDAEPTISWVAWLGDLESRPLLEGPDGSLVTV
ncbi:MAG: dimethylsulfonioproprionate lyase family protein [Acidimicrobiia bacterium]|nr:dimethylsulfonioproprionate lyase family protein [Acidimicrobiia bacterium]